ncbi:hypothetical protein BY996DRAFT_6452662 [Phakopsora pachyrhizi]|uniref:Uncharacterized protein n=1 Tax=Phakopsora pachyrhizi TaxID=170000 RepID=A0AAV0B8N8_PHAPC|nr:hypothetical protein BY996DRAFT_6452662 [Phakopsora pachyrhizi]CAH7682508.1 hypothetical protein PPACK8108_LOCUS15448 [Phakopsora pachyrhizi]
MRDNRVEGVLLLEQEDEKDGHVDKFFGGLEEQWIKRKAEFTIDDKNRRNKD